MWGKAIVVVLHRWSCPLCCHRECATSLLKSARWCHSWEYSTHTHTHRHTHTHTHRERVNCHSFFVLNYPPSPLTTFPPSPSSPEIGPSCLPQRIHPPPPGDLSATWRRAVWWLRRAGRPCGPSSGPCSQTDSDSQNARQRTARRGRPPNW